MNLIKIPIKLFIYLFLLYITLINIIITYSLTVINNFLNQNLGKP